MAIQNRRGPYSKFDPSKLTPAEIAVVTSGDPLCTDGKSIYACFSAGDVKRMATYEDMEENIEQCTDEIIKNGTEGVVKSATETVVQNTAAKIDTAIIHANNAADRAEQAYINYTGNAAYALSGVLWRGDKKQDFSFEFNDIVAGDFLLVINGYYSYYRTAPQESQDKNGAVLLGFHVSSDPYSSYVDVNSADTDPHSKIGVMISGNSAMVYIKTGMDNLYEYHVTEISMLRFQ